MPKLNSLGIYKISDLALADPVMLEKYFKNQAYVMIKSANGIDDSIVDSNEYHPSCIGNEITLPHNISSKREAYDKLLILSEYVSKRLRKEEKYASVVCVTIKDEFLKRRSHQKKLLNETNIEKEIYKTACMIFDEFWNGENIRLIGIRLDGLTLSKKYQGSIFENVEKREHDEKIDKLIDNINFKFGKNTIKKAGIDNLNSKKEV